MSDENVSEAVVAEESAPAERMYSSSEVDRIAGSKKKAGEERAKRELESQYGSEIAELRKTIEQMQGGAESKEPTKVDDQDLEAKINEAIENRSKQKLQREYEDKRIDALEDMFKRGAEKHPDFVEKMRDLGEYEAFEHILPELPAEDRDVVAYAMSQDPLRAVQINVLHGHNRNHAVKELQKFAESLRQNERDKAEAGHRSPNIANKLPQSNLARSGKEIQQNRIDDFLGF